MYNRVPHTAVQSSDQELDDVDSDLELTEDQFMVVNYFENVRCLAVVSSLAYFVDVAVSLVVFILFAIMQSKVASVAPCDGLCIALWVLLGVNLLTKFLPMRNSLSAYAPRSAAKRWAAMQLDSVLQRRGHLLRGLAGQLPYDTKLHMIRVLMKDE